MVADGSEPEPGGVIRVTKGQTLPIRFRIHSARRDAAGDTPRLKVLLGPGVAGRPITSDSVYRPRGKVRYAFEAAPGHDNLIVMLDGEYVPAQGVVTMDRAHLLIATADVRVAPPPGGEDLLRSARAILTSPDPVAAYQSHLDAVGDLFASVGEPEALRRLAAIEYLAFDPVRDADAMLRVDSVLAGHGFALRGSAVMATTRQGTGPASLSQSAAGTPTTAYYVNGVLNSFTQAQTSARVLEVVVDEAGTPNIDRVGVLYNRTYSAQMTPFEKRTTMCLQDLARSEHFLGDLSLRFRYLRCMGDFGQHLGTNFDLVEALRQVMQINGYASFATEADARMIGDTIRQEWRSGRNVILVPHSQGNLMSQQAINYAKSSSASGAGSPRCVGVVSLAAPVSSNWPLSQGTDLFPVAVKGDMILWLGMNHFARTETSLSRQADAKVAEWDRLTQMLGPGAGVAARIIQAKWGLRLHGAVESYMQQAESRQKVRTGIQQLANRNCNGGVAITGYWVNDDGSMRLCGGYFVVTLRPADDGWNVTHTAGHTYTVTVPSANPIRYRPRVYAEYMVGGIFSTSDESWDITWTRNSDGKYAGTADIVWIETGFWIKDERKRCITWAVNQTDL
ncbi:MAG TPA: hypothetical protein VHG35_05665 [Gemmatimonadales bacterium]|nr:hypothetical protein [Gemmatimonadales bacterium]